MKKRLWLSGLIAAVFLGGVFIARADEDQPPSGKSDQPMMDGGKMGGGRIEKMKEKLGLTDDQAAKLKDLFKSQMEANKPLRDQMKIDMDTLQQKVDAKASDGDIKKLLDKLDSEQKQMQESREKMKDQLRSILTPTQQAKMLLGMRKMGMMDRGKGHRGWKKGGKDGGPGKGDEGGQSAPNGDSNI